MSVLTAVRYAEITGDTTSAASAVEERIDEAVELLEDYLGRPVELAERTEAMRPDRDGWLWPKATPITDAGDYDIEGYGLVGSHWGGGSIIDPAITVEVTYTGGWTDETLPACIARDLAFAAWRLANPTLPTADVAANATSVRLGDAAITFQGGAGGVAHGDTDSWWSRRTRSYRYRRVDTGPDRRMVEL